ncbi:hypothetical protein H0H92_007437 [Tricholoma furcatifolium]|nr:hypothetical protein H0H92_007437 [Tricholoma furcatifolium]
MPPKPRPVKPPVKDVKSTQKPLMPPPPVPAVSLAILEPEMNALSTCLKHFAPKPPQSLTASLGREIEKYDQIVDAMESHLYRAIAALQRDLKREEKRIKSLEDAAVATRTRSKSASLSPTSTRVPLPPVPEAEDTTQQPASGAPLPTPTHSPPAPPTSAGLGRRPSAISISSLQRPALPLKLDLSSSALRITPEEAMYTSGLASPVTLAPKSARIAPNDFPTDLMAAFASSSQTIDLTMDSDDGDIKMGLDGVGGSAERPIELDLQTMDIDMAMTDLFGDPTESGSSDANPIDGLFSPIVIEPSGNVDDKPKPEETFLEGISEAGNSIDIFSSLAAPGGADEAQPSKDPSSIIPQSAPSPASLLASLASESNLQDIAQITSNNMSVSETPFDISSLDLSNLDPTLFGGSSGSDMNFSMDMDQFMATVNEDTGAGDGKTGGEP